MNYLSCHMISLSRSIVYNDCAMCLWSTYDQGLITISPSKPEIKHNRNQEAFYKQYIVC